MHEIEIVLYETPGGVAPYEEWFYSLRDTMSQSRINKRLNRLRTGNFGDCQSVGEGVFELRLHFGPGYRIYFGHEGTRIVILITGGAKSSQGRDIQRAKVYWQDYRRRTHES